MSRTRLIRPAFFKHGELYDAEQETGLPLRVAFAGLWTIADKPDGRFAWKPRDIKSDVCPHDQLDFAAVLDALHRHGFVERYVVDGKHYGFIPSFPTHQTFHKSEAASKHPAPTDPRATTVKPPVVNGENREDTVAVAGTVAGTGTGANYSAPMAPERSEREELWALVRAFLYVPDGKPPLDWDESRDGSILKALRRRHSVRDIAAAIEGVAVIRDYPGRYADEVEWLTPNSKATLRVLYNTSSGVLPMFSLATAAFWKRQNTDTERRKGGQLERVGSIATRAIA